MKKNKADTENSLPPYHPQVYQPEADTYLLREVALRELQPGGRVLEVGTGSGFIASGVAEKSSVVATDINPHACRSARIMGVDVVRTDLMAALKGPFDLIIFNPPYLPTRPAERMDDWLEYALDGGESGRIAIKRFADDLSRVLAQSGRALLLISELTGIHEVQQIFSQHGMLSFIVSQKKVEDELLIVLRVIKDMCRFNE